MQSIIVFKPIGHVICNILKCAKVAVQTRGTAIYPHLPRTFPVLALKAPCPGNNSTLRKNNLLRIPWRGLTENIWAPESSSRFKSWLYHVPTVRL